MKNEKQERKKDDKTDQTAEAVKKTWLCGHVN